MEPLVIYGLYIHSFQITVDITCRYTVFENHKKVSFYIASEASYVYILSGQKFIKNARNGPIWRVFENLIYLVKQCYQKVRYNWTKIGGKYQN